VATDSDPTAIHVLRGSNRSSSGNIGKRFIIIRKILLLVQELERRCLDTLNCIFLIISFMLTCNLILTTTANI